jgi:hypothetical protein
MRRSHWAVSQTLFFFHISLIVSNVISPAAHAAGYVRFDASSFFLSADNQPTTVTTLLLGPEMSTEGKWISAAMDIKGVAFVSDVSSFTVEAGNLYVATSPQWMPHHQITIGRRIYDWNVMEDQWGLGLWSARFLWNPLAPERIGMTGAFYSYESAKWRFLAFGTPISPPERSFPIRDQNGQLLADSRDYVPPYQQLLLMNQVIPINYSIQYPPLSQLLVRPGGGVQVRYGGSDGPWASGSYGLMPMHEVQMGIQAAYDPVQAQVDAVVHPITLFHHLATFETGYRGRAWSLWASVTGESPIQPQIPASWQLAPMGPALLSSAGGSMRLDEYFTFSTSLLKVNEDLPPLAPGQIPLNLPSRFQYTEAVQAEGKWTGIPQLTADLHYVYDLANLSTLLSFDLLYQPTVKRSSILRSMFGGYGAWAFGVGTDIISTQTDTGYIGQYYGNDRIRGRISYAF